MTDIRKGDMEKLLKTIAHAHGITVQEVKEEMRAAIDQAQNNPDLKKREEFKKYFGDRTPTPEEFIYIMTKKLK